GPPAPPGPASRSPPPRSIPASGDIADPPIPIMCMCFALANVLVPFTPLLPAPESPASPRPSTATSPSLPAALSASAFSYARSATHTQSAPSAAPRPPHKSPARSACRPPAGHNPENLPPQSPSRPQRFLPAPDAAACDPLDRASRRDLPARESRPARLPENPCRSSSAASSGIRPRFFRPHCPIPTTSHAAEYYIHDWAHRALVKTKRYLIPNVAPRNRGTPRPPYDVQL